MALRYKRGDKHPSNAELFFLRYLEDEEIWVSEAHLALVKDRARASNAKQRQTPKHKERMRVYFQSYNKLPRQKARQAAYYKRPDVRSKMRDRHNAKAEVIARREARLAWRKERADYRNTDEYKALVRERGKRSYLKRVASGKMAKFYRDKRRTNIQYRLACNMRKLIHSALTNIAGVRKSIKSQALIGCSVSALKVHLESQFTEGMTWENYGRKGWHIDHHIPCARFDLTDIKQQHLAFYFENLRPLWEADNIRKSDRVTVDGKEVRARDIRNIIPFKAA